MAVIDLSDGDDEYIGTICDDRSAASRGKDVIWGDFGD